MFFLAIQVKIGQHW